MNIQELALQLQREYMKEYRKNNREKIREYRNQWARENPDKIKDYKTKCWEKKAAALIENHQ